MHDLDPVAPPAAEAIPPPHRVDPLLGDVRALLADGRTLIEAELAFQQARARYAMGAAGGIAGWIGLALALAFFALMAVVLGLLLALAARFGPWLATLMVVAGTGVLAAICVVVALGRVRAVRRKLRDSGAGDGAR